MLNLRAVRAANAAIAGEPLDGTAIRACLAGRSWPQFTAAERALLLSHFRADPGLAQDSAGPDVRGSATVQEWLRAYDLAAQEAR